MPPRARITREMLIDAGFEIARDDGAENINARAVAGRLACSTQPVMYHFADLLAGIRSELTVVNFTRRTSHYQNLSRFHLRCRNQLLCDGTRFLSDCFKIHFVSLLAKQQYLCKRRLTLFP